MNAFAVGGTIRTTLNTAGALAERHDVEVASVFRRRTDPELPVPPGVRLRALSDLREETLGRGVRRRVAAQRTRLMSTRDFRHPEFNLLTDIGLVRYLASVRDGVLIGTRPSINLAIAHLAAPSVVRVGQDHMHLAAYSDELRAQIGAVYPRLDLVTALTRRDAAAYRRHLGRRTRVECMPNGIRASQRPPASLDAKVVVAAGRLSRQKGFDRLLAAWAKVASRHQGWELRIFGDGKLQPRLEARIDELDIADSARLMGFTPRLDEELARASLYVMSSRREGFPMVLLEAMSAGLPVVSFDCPTGPRDIVRDGVDGYVVRNRDVEALAAAMSELMGDADRRKAFGAAAREGAARYDLDAVAASWEALLAELAAAKPPGAGTTPAGPALSLLGRVATRHARRLVPGR